MKLAKTIAIVACAGLLSVAAIGSSARHAYAQDSDGGGLSGGAFGSPNSDAADQSSPDTKSPSLNIGGCWKGQVQDTADGMGTAEFNFVQSSNGTKLEAGSDFDFEWPDNAFARGPMKGSVSSKGFKFKGNADCPVNGSATGSASMLVGTVKFGGSCKNLFKNVTISISPGTGCK